MFGQDKGPGIVELIQVQIHSWVGKNEPNKLIL